MNKNKPHWSIMTKAQNGHVSVVRNLTYPEVCAIYDRLDPDYGRTIFFHLVHPDFKDESKPPQSGCLGFGGTLNDGDIVLKEIFGPPGWNGLEEGDVGFWPVYIDIYTDAEGKILEDEYQSEEGMQEAERRRAMQERGYKYF